MNTLSRMGYRKLMGLLLCGLDLADLTPRHHTNIVADIPERHPIKPAVMQPGQKH